MQPMVDRIDSEPMVAVLDITAAVTGRTRVTLPFS